MTEWNFLKSTPPLQLVDFRDCKIFSCFSGASSMYLSAQSKIKPITSFLFSRRPFPFSNFYSDIMSGLPSFVNNGGRNTVWIS